MLTFRYALALALGIALPLLIQRWDKSRFDAEQRARAWNAASWGAALYAFGPLSMLGWCWVTRPRWPWWARLLAGLLAAVAIGAAMQGVDWLFDRGDDGAPAVGAPGRPRGAQD